MAKKLTGTILDDSHQPLSDERMAEVDAMFEQWQQRKKKERALAQNQPMNLAH